MFKSLFSLRNLCYFLYTIGLLLVLLYVRFPTEKFKMFCEKRVEYYLQIDRCIINKIRYKFPFTIRFENIKLEDVVTESKSTIEISDFEIIAGIKRLAREFDVKGRAYGGTFQAELKVEYKAENFLFENVTVSGVELEQLLHSLQLSERKARGVLSFVGMYKAPFAQLFHGESDINVTIANGSIQLVQPILSLSDLDFKKVQFQLSQDRDIIKLDAGSLMSDQLKATYVGKISLTELWFNSQLKLNGAMEPLQTMYKQDPGLQKNVKRLMRRYNMKALPFRIGGTLKVPTFRFGK